MDLCARAPIHKKVQHIAYDMFFHELHPPGSVHQVLMDRFSKHWDKPSLLGHMSSGFYSQVACHTLKKLSTEVPARVHLANVRFHCNGWHTEARYQRRLGSRCNFCQDPSSQDCIEHLLVCPRIQTFFPARMKSGSPP